MSWTLAPNLLAIEALAKHCYPGLVVYALGDAAHAAEASDHNPDARGMVHAIDLMFEDDVRYNHGAPTTLAWLLTPGVRNSLQYVIHDRKIWSVASKWQPLVYHGTDPHTNHIHVSGKHGTVGKNAATGTGYNTAAEKMTPAGTPCATASHPSVPVEEDMALTKDDLDLLFADPRMNDLIWRVYAMANLNDNFPNGSMKGQPVGLSSAIKNTASAVSMIPTTALPAAPADLDALAAKLADLLATRLQS